MSDLVVLSHLPWDFVWQRPQHLISRLARRRRTWFVEEPGAGAVEHPVLHIVEAEPVTRVWLEVPGRERHMDFDDPAAADYADVLVALLGTGVGRTVWLYTPLALPIAESLGPDVLVFDVMDDLASFAHAPPRLRERHRQALECATVVFAGGRSLHAGVAAIRPDAHLFPSGVEPEHYAVERPAREPGSRPVAGYVGVIDERIDLGLLEKLAAALPDWDVRVVGPVAKIDESSLPRAANLHYPGPQPYEALPSVMAGFHVALMPFALGESTRSISPTKTLEYFAAGLPVVSTRVPDVVADYGGLVRLADDGAQFAAACRDALGEKPEERRLRYAPVLARQRWDAIANRMEQAIQVAARRAAA